MMGRENTNCQGLTKELAIPSGKFFQGPKFVLLCKVTQCAVLYRSV
jgi:hypothetical protein